VGKLARLSKSQKKPAVLRASRETPATEAAAKRTTHAPKARRVFGRRFLWQKQPPRLLPRAEIIALLTPATSSSATSTPDAAPTHAHRCATKGFPSAVR
jgi:hypothetical protein